MSTNIEKVYLIAFLDPNDRNQPKAILNYGFPVYIENAVYGKVQRGDTLYKRAGSFKHYLIRKGDTTIYYAGSVAVGLIF